MQMNIVHLVAVLAVIFGCPCIVRADFQQASLVLFLVTGIFICLFFIPVIGPVAGFFLIPLFLHFLYVAYFANT